MRWLALVWDDRDKESEEPISELGEFPSESEALNRIAEYLAGEHGPHIYRYSVSAIEEIS